MGKGKLYEKALELSDRVSDKQNETYDAVGLEVINDLFDDAKADICPEKYWFTWAHTSQENDDQLTKDYKNLLLKLEKWFGTSNG